MKSTQILCVSRSRPDFNRLDLNCEKHGWLLTTANSGWEALECVHSNLGPDLIVLNFVAGESDSLHALRWLRRMRPDLPVLVLADVHDSSLRLETFRLGAQDFLVHPLRPQELESAIQRCLFDHKHRPRERSLCG